jgi:hypothetical protein
MPTVIYTIAGATTLSQFEQPDSPEFTFEPDGMVCLKRRWKFLSESRALSVAPRVAYTDVTYGNFRCAQTTIKRMVNGKEDAWSLVESTYYGVFAGQPMPVIVEWTTTRNDRPIEQHPDFNTATFGYPLITDGVLTSGTPTTKIFDKAINEGGGFAFKKFAPDSTFRGIDAYMVATAQWKVTDYLLGPNFDMTSLCKIDVPPSVVLSDGSIVSPPYQVSANKYLKVQHDCRNVLKGVLSIYERQRTWLYYDLGWVSEVYS